MLLLKPSSEAALLTSSELLSEHLLELKTQESIRAQLAAMFPTLEWSGDYASVSSIEFHINPCDLTSISLRVVRALDEYSWLRQLELAFNARVYDAQTGSWFQELDQSHYLACHAQIINQEV